MRTALLILLAQGAIGAFDTLWFHEWRGRLPFRAEARMELSLHAARDFVYAVLFSTFAWYTWEEAWAAVLIALLAVEIAITLADFVVEDRTRPLAAGERVTHAIHDFTGKLRQPSVAEHVKSYVEWRRAVARARALGGPEPEPAELFQDDGLASIRHHHTSLSRIPSTHIRRPRRSTVEAIFGRDRIGESEYRFKSTRLVHLGNIRIRSRPNNRRYAIQLNGSLSRTSMPLHIGVR